MAASTASMCLRSDSLFVNSVTNCQASSLVGIIGMETKVDCLTRGREDFNRSCLVGPLDPDFAKTSSFAKSYGAHVVAAQSLRGRAIARRSPRHRQTAAGPLVGGFALAA